MKNFYYKFYKFIFFLVTTDGTKLFPKNLLFSFSNLDEFQRQGQVITRKDF